MQLQSLRLTDCLNSKVFFWVRGILTAMITSYLFYENVLFSILMIPYIFFYVKEKVKEREIQQMQQFSEEFKDGLLAVSFALDVGYSIENSFAEAINELENLYGRDSDIVRSFRMIVTKLKHNENLEDILQAFAEEKEIEDIKFFSEIFRYAKRSGGDLISIIKNTTTTIKQKIDVSKEIQTVISGKKMEQKVLSIIPFGIIIYLRLASKDFISPLYGNIFGQFVMSVCLVVYVFSIYWSKKIINIEV